MRCRPWSRQGSSLHWRFSILDSSSPHVKPERTPTSSGIEGITRPKALFYKGVGAVFGLSWTAVLSPQECTPVFFQCEKRKARGTSARELRGGPPSVMSNLSCHLRFTAPHRYSRSSPPRRSLIGEPCIEELMEGGQVRNCPFWHRHVPVQPPRSPNRDNPVFSKPIGGPPAWYIGRPPIQ